MGELTKTYSLKQWELMIDKFNKMPFIEQIKTVKENSDLFKLGNDGNWWNVRFKNEEIHEHFDDIDKPLCIENEWGSSETRDLIRLLGIKIFDCE